MNRPYPSFLSTNLFMLTHTLGIEYWDRLYQERLARLTGDDPFHVLQRRSDSDDEEEQQVDADQADHPDLLIWFGTDAVLLCALTVSSLSPHRTVLDLGAGDGHLTRLLANLPGVRRVLCTDCAPHAVLLARHLHEPQSELLPDGGAVCGKSGCTVEYFVDDATKASIIPDETVDVVVDKGTLDAIAALHIGVEKRHAWAATVARVLRDGGFLVLLTSSHARDEVVSILASVPHAAFALSERSVERDDFRLYVFRLTKAASAIPPHCAQTSLRVADTDLRILERRMRLADDDTTADADDGDLDANFFEPEYDLAAATGSNVWESSFVLASALDDASFSCFDGLRGRRVVELGAGVGLLSLALAAFGCHVLATDLAPVVKGQMSDNVARNASVAACEPLRSNVWRRTLPIGARGGSVGTAALNWLEPLERQFDEPLDADFVVAADTLWLESLVAPFVNTSLALLGSAPQRRMLLAYRERGTESSSVFCTTERVLRAFVERGCVATEVWRRVSLKSPTQSVVLFEIKRS